MEDEDPSRPSIGFPLGLALLLLTLVLMTSFFTCCLHWDKLRSLLRISTDDVHHNPHDVDHRSPRNATPPRRKVDQNQGQSVPVLMPGDQVPRFIAMACPCRPPAAAVEKITVKVQKPPPFPVRLY